MSLPRPADKYDPRWAAENNRALEQKLAMAHRKGADVELGQDEKLILRSPNGSRWSITVSNAGTISATAL